MDSERRGDSAEVTQPVCGIARGFSLAFVAPQDPAHNVDLSQACSGGNSPLPLSKCGKVQRITVEQSPPGGKLKVMHTDEANKETLNLQERSGSNDDSEEKSVASVRRRGRKPKRSLILSDDAESSEPERKRQKSVSEATEDKKDQESEEEEEEEEDEEPSGATTRSSTRSEAQRSKAQLSPSAKRKREASPPGARTRGQQRVEEAPVKKAKR